MLTAQFAHNCYDQNGNMLSGDGRAITYSILAGAAALTGGKFFKGFVTAAFAQMWNIELTVGADVTGIVGNGAGLGRGIALEFPTP